MWLIPGAVLACIYAITSDGHPNGLLFLAIIVIIIGVIFQLKQTDKVIDRIIVETLDMAAEPPRLLGSGSFTVGSDGTVSDLKVDGMTVDDEGNITDASPEAMAILFEILDLVKRPREEK